MFTAKEKDYILSQIYKEGINSNDTTTNLIVKELESEGLIHALYATGGKVHACRLLPKGEIFLERGGYTKLEKDKLKSQNKIWWKERGTKVADQLIALIITGIIGGFIGGFVGSYFS